MNYNTLFYFDIETVGEHIDFNTFKDNDLRGAELFEKKFNKNSFMSDRVNSVEESYLEQSPIFSTFGKIICVSFGYFTDKNPKGYTLNSLYGKNEYELMLSVADLFGKVYDKNMILSGFRINSFDIPWLVHKMTKYDIKLPKILEIYDKKPWEIQSFDLADKWKFGFRYFNTLDDVCYELGIDSPKDGIDGSKVHHTYWVEDGLEDIKKYCQKDVYASMLVGKKMLQ